MLNTQYPTVLWRWEYRSYDVELVTSAHLLNRKSMLQYSPAELQSAGEHFG